MAANYVLLEKITVGAAGASSVTFSGIPQTGYTDLVVKINARMTNAGPNWSKMQLNGSAANFTVRYLEGSGSGAASANTATNYQGLDTGTTVTANVFSNNEIYIPNYASANYKSYSVDTVTENNGASAYMGLLAGLWSNTAAITSILLAPDSGNYAQYSTFYLYGVAALGTTPVIVPYATGGDTIMTDGSYWYHTFISSGTFTPQKALSVDYLVVAGGGGGGNLTGGGGGGGGMRTASAFSVISAATVTVGAGGAAGVSYNRGTVGADSVFSTITSTGGGGGGGYNQAASDGGAGGGGTGRFTGNTGGAGNTPSTSPSQGASGGNGTDTGNAGTYYAGGGGGGGGSSGAVGTVGGTVSPYGGAGGAGTASSLSGSSVTYSGGGGGCGNVGNALGGSGGGGNGGGNSPASAGSNGTANRGGGGGGNRDTDPSGAGGSGTVIVRYAV